MLGSVSTVKVLMSVINFLSDKFGNWPLLLQ